MTQAGSSSGSFLLDSVPGLKHDADMAAEWSVGEQQRLEEGLDKYAAEPSIMKYIKIAAMLNDKDVRAVALRCRWMTDKLVASSSKINISSASLLNMAPYSLIPNHLDHNERCLLKWVFQTSNTNCELNLLQTSHKKTFIKSATSNIDLRFSEQLNLTLMVSKPIGGLTTQMKGLPLSSKPLANSIIWEALIVPTHMS
ncbi:hypothetical protein LOK49_LG11G00134, partial [Camellia lanceoleosa]